MNLKTSIEAVKRELIMLLAIIAGVVLHGLINGENMWGWIVVYWAVLTVKNLLDTVTIRGEKTNVRPRNEQR